MSIMIKGIKFPDVGVRDVVIAFANHCLLITDECGKELFYGEYVEIPTPHGRLIDADELTKHMRSYYPSIDHLCRSQHVVTKGDIDKAPTIIEAENSSAIDDDVKKYCDYLKSETYDFCNRIENGEVSE